MQRMLRMTLLVTRPLNPSILRTTSRVLEMRKIRLTPTITILNSVRKRES
jgi:hypothetical protein